MRSIPGTSPSESCVLYDLTIHGLKSGKPCARDHLWCKYAGHGRVIQSRRRAAVTYQVFETRLRVDPFFCFHRAYRLAIAAAGRF